jgi:signal peptidase
MKNIFKTFAIIIVLTLGGFLFLLSNHVGGFRAFTVMSASMEPTIPTGALVITQKIFPKELHGGDVITFLRPNNSKEFITHRVNKTEHSGRLTAFKTKGDNNKTADTWTVAGGSVIGKVILTIPYLGYILSFSQTKLGIALFILVPAFFILFDELNTIVRLFTNRREKSTNSGVTETAMIIFFMGIIVSISAHPSQALLSDSATLTGNQFTLGITTPTITQIPTITETPIPTESEPTPSVIVTQTPTGTPSTCDENTTVTVSNNGAGSVNVVTVNNNHSTTIHQSSNSSVITNINTHSSTGNNTESTHTNVSVKNHHH